MKEKNLTRNAVSKILPVYRQSTGSVVQFFDCNFRHVEVDDKPGIEQNICRHCTGRHGSKSCRELHINLMRESGHNGRPNIYQCELGLMFWTCAIYSDGRFSGALRCSGYLNEGLDISLYAEKCRALCGVTISPEEFESRILVLPSGSAEKIQSLAEMLLICAVSLSKGSENHHEMLRLRSERQASLSAHMEELKTRYPKGSALPGYPLEKERQLISLIRQGNKKEAGRLLDEVLASMAFGSKDQFKHIQLRALELVVLFARAGTNFNSSTSMEKNAHCVKLIQSAKTIEDVAAVLHGMVDSISRQIVSFQGIPHASAMRRAEIFIRENLTRKISLREISEVAGLSPPYFSTIFKEEMGENLSRYVNQLRVEKASRMLLETNLSLSDIAAECCFEDQSWFSKIFKSFTGTSPGKYRSQGGNMALKS